MARTGTITIAGQTVKVNQMGMSCASILSSTGFAAPLGGALGFFSLTTPGWCSWKATTTAPWIKIISSDSGAGNATINFLVNPNPTYSARSGNIIVAGRSYLISQPPLVLCSIALSTIRVFMTSSGGPAVLNFSAPAGCAWTAATAAPWITITSGQVGEGSGSVSFSVAANNGPARSATLEISGQTVVVSQSAQTAPITSANTLRFVPVTPCRLMDTREGQGKIFPFGPPSMPAANLRDVPVPSAGCDVPAGAQAYSLNVTVVPQGPLSYLTIWPTGQAQPFVSTLNAPSGQVVANASIVPAGLNGSVSLYVTNATDVVLDINGYFVSTGSLFFHPVTPCRVMDTRAGQGTTGSFGPPSIAGGSSRSVPIPSGRCSIPASAQAYSLNATVVPQGPLSYLTLWPAGQPQPLVSTLNAPGGQVLANAAIVPAGTGGAINVYASNTTDLILDINGYFDTTLPGLSFTPMTPCRAVDTRAGQGTTGAFGPPTIASAATKNIPLPSSRCSVPATAQAYSLNATVVPPGPLSYLTLWPTGQAQPLVSTLNAGSGGVVANAAIVPAGSSGSISAFAANATDLILDINGYFAP